MISAEKQNTSYPLELLRRNGYRIVGTMAGGFHSFLLGRQGEWMYAQQYYDEFYTACRWKGSTTGRMYGPDCDIDAARFAGDYIAAHRNSSNAAPLFMTIFLTSTHYPYETEGSEVQWDEGVKWDLTRGFFFDAAGRTTTETMRSKLMKRYLFTVRVIDSLLETIAGWLRPTDLLAFTGDHGEVSIFSNFSGPADGERRGLGRIGA